jgi:hypothetical protein
LDTGVLYDDRKQPMNIRTRSTLSVACAALLLAQLFAPAPANAQSNSNGNFGVGPIDRGLVIGAIVGIAAVVGLGVTFLVLHNRGVVVGCIAESGGKMTLVDSDKKVYSLLDAGPSLPVGERAKLKGHKSGPASAPSFQVDKILKDYGHCKP